MIRFGMSTSCIYPLGVESSFRLAKLAGYDGVEVMVTADKATQRPESLLALSKKYDIPILSIHAPVLFLTQWIWGGPQEKLERAAELAAAVGASTVVVHPPFVWQGRYARRFLDVVRATALATGVEIAVENMFTWKVLGRTMKIYAPGWDPTLMDADSMTLDFSHASLSGKDSLEFAMQMGDRLRHIHLCDGAGSVEDGKVFDSHLLPGDGDQPVADVLAHLGSTGWSGSIVAEVHIHARTEERRLTALRTTLDFARAAIAGAPSTATAARSRPLRQP
ncbi:MAG: sugar phosphate isomerase/epimerase [Microbacteriaceae bacterium]|nr:sugar phosphate isomerase/epimerase [Microbacteriaceae bacterium]